MKHQLGRQALTVLALALLAGGVQAQGAEAEKRALVAKILKAQQPGIEQFAIGLAQGPMQQMLRNAEQVVMARVPADKREATAKAMVGEAQAALKDLTPTLKASAMKHAQSSFGSTLEGKFSVAELKEIAQVLESPTMRRFNQVGPEMQQALAQAIANDTKGAVEPRLKALDQKLVQLVNAALPPPPASPHAPKQP
ncbi:MAG: hypothetical protein ACK520_03805 [Inhella sp.]